MLIFFYLIHLTLNIQYMFGTEVRVWDKKWTWLKCSLYPHADLLGLTASELQCQGSRDVWGGTDENWWKEGPTTKFPLPSKLSFGIKGQVKSIPDKKKLKEFIITKPVKGCSLRRRWSKMWTIRWQKIHIY